MLYEHEPRKRGDQQTFLGEGCTVWTMTRTRNPGLRHPPLERTSCVTDDGIELWYVIANPGYIHGGATATRLERRAVAPADAQPPRDLLKPDWWTDDGPQQLANATRRDFETVMERAGSEPQRLTRTLRGQGGWLSTDDTYGTMRSEFKLEHRDRRIMLRFRADEKGTPKELTLSRVPSPDPAQTPVISMTPKALDRSETILGEVCQWFNMTPGMADAGRGACRTHDGILLKETSWGRGIRDTGFSAVQFVRRPIAPSEVMPPAFVLDHKTWGLPE